MKKKYIVPHTEMVTLDLSCTILDDEGGFGRWSNGAGGEFGDSKENTGLWGEVDDEDPWANSKGADLWSGDTDEEEW